VDLVQRLTRTGLKRGLFEGSQGWLLVGISLTALRVARRVLAEPEVRATVELKPGDAVEVRVIDPPTR
jgi:hypothetical protein